MTRTTAKSPIPAIKPNVITESPSSEVLVVVVDVPEVVVVVADVVVATVVVVVAVVVVEASSTVTAKIEEHQLPLGS